MTITGVNITSSDDIFGQLLENLMLNSLWEKKPGTMRATL